MNPVFASMRFLASTLWFIFAAIAFTQIPPQTAPTPTHEGVAYGTHDQQKIDLWLAESAKPAPLVIFIHGGGFRAGSRKQINPGDIRYFLGQGISVASLEYRLTQNGPYPIPMDDGARAVQWLRANAAKYNLDKTRFAAYGGSAGACISMWLAFREDRAYSKSDDLVSRESTRLIAAGSQNGQPTLDYRTFKEWFGAKSLVMHPALFPMFGIRSVDELDKPEIRKLMEDASPIHHLTKDDPPIFLMNGSTDDPVSETTNPNVWVHHPRLGIELKKAMDKLGIECHVLFRGGPAVTEYRNLQEFLAKKLLAK